VPPQDEPSALAAAMTQGRILVMKLFPQDFWGNMRDSMVNLAAGTLYALEQGSNWLVGTTAASLESAGEGAAQAGQVIQMFTRQCIAEECYEEAS
jgi:hypothetical protein